MLRLELTQDEAELLRDMLRHALSDIDVEVFRTDTHDFTTMLKGRRDLMEHILEKLPAAPVAK